MKKTYALSLGNRLSLPLASAKDRGSSGVSRGVSSRAAANLVASTCVKSREERVGVEFAEGVVEDQVTV